VKNHRRPEHAFARRYAAADVALLAEVDRAMGALSRPAVEGRLEDPHLPRSTGVDASPSIATPSVGLSQRH